MRMLIIMSAIYCTSLFAGTGSAYNPKCDVDGFSTKENNELYTIVRFDTYGCDAKFIKNRPS